MSMSMSPSHATPAPLQAPVTYEIQPTSCHCGGGSAWVEVHRDSSSISQQMRGCVCHQHPSNLDLESGTLLPTQCWVIVGQRGLTMVFETEQEAHEELRDLDDKYRPAYLGRARIDAITITAVHEHSAEMADPTADPLRDL